MLFRSEMKISKDPALFAIIYEDIAAMAGLVIALVGVYLSDVFQSTIYDGIASLLIGVVLCLVAAIMLWETRSLLIGESANSDVVKKIYQEVSSDPDVLSLKTPLTMQMAPHEILVALDVIFKPEIINNNIAGAIKRIENKIRLKIPEAKNI